MAALLGGADTQVVVLRVGRSCGAAVAVGVLTAFVAVGPLPTVEAMGAEKRAPRVTVEVRDGVLRITGTPRADMVRMYIYLGNRVLVWDEGGERTHKFEVRRDRFTSVRMDGRGGDDRLSNSDVPRTTIVGGEGNDRLDGGLAAEKILGGPGSDRVRGWRGVDVVRLGAGADTFMWEREDQDGRDRIAFGRGRDTLRIGGTPLVETVVLTAGRGGRLVLRGGPRMRDLEHVRMRAGSGDDSLTATRLGRHEVSVQVKGGPGSDDLHTAGGRDYVSGGRGKDRLNAGGGADLVFGGSESDRITDRDDDDDTLFGGNHLAVEGCEGTVGIDRITALGRGHDLVFGGNLNPGGTFCDGGDGVDVIDIADGRGGDTAYGDHRRAGGPEGDDTITADPGDTVEQGSSAGRRGTG